MDVWLHIKTSTDELHHELHLCKTHIRTTQHMGLESVTNPEQVVQFKKLL